MFEIRQYHYDLTKFDLYKNWANKEAVPHLKTKLDLVGFRMDNGKKNRTSRVVIQSNTNTVRQISLGSSVGTQ